MFVKSVALLLLKLQAKFRCTNEVINEIINGLSDVTNLEHDILKQNLQSQLKDELKLDD